MTEEELQGGEILDIEDNENQMNVDSSDGEYDHEIQDGCDLPEEDDDEEQGVALGIKF